MASPWLDLDQSSPPQSSSLLKAVDTFGVHPWAECECPLQPFQGFALYRLKYLVGEGQ